MTDYVISNQFAGSDATIFYKLELEIGAVTTKRTIGHFTCNPNIQCLPIPKMVYIYETYFSNSPGGGAIQKYSDSLQKMWLSKITATETPLGPTLPSLGLSNLTVDSLGNAYVTSMVEVTDEGNKFNIMNLVHKFDTDGNRLWSNQFSIGNIGYSKNLAVSTDGTMLFVGMEYHSQVFKINAVTGELISTGGFPLSLTYWGETVSEINTVSFSHIKYGADGYLYVVQYNDNTSLLSDFVSKINPADGSLVWRFRALPTDVRRTVYDIDINANGHVALAIGAAGETIYNTLYVLDSDMTIIAETRGAIGNDLEPCRGIAIDDNDVVYFSGWSGGLTSYNVGTETKTTLVGLREVEGYMPYYPQFYEIAIDNKADPKFLFIGTVEIAHAPYNDKFIKYNIQTGEVEWNYRSYAAPYSESGINRDSFVVQPNVFRAYKIKVINRSLNVSYNIGIKDLQVN